MNEIFLALIGAVVWRKDDEGSITVREQHGEAKNVLWVRTGGLQYAFKYDHNAGAILMRRNSIRGEAVQTFTNQTPLATVKQVFEGL